MEHGLVKRKRILLVEDTSSYCELLEEAFCQQGSRYDLQIERTVTSALAFLQNVHVLPDLIVLDLKLRDRSGTELLRRIRADTRLALIPVVMLTASDNPIDMKTCYSLGANSCIVKPDTFVDLITLAGDLCRYWLRWNYSFRSVTEG